MKILSLFSGIGAFEKALTNLNVPFELVGYSEIDKYASKSYAAVHNVDESMNLGDITKINEKELPKNIDLITYGFPCQDISIAGKQKGLFNEDGTKTRSGLFFEALRIIEETQPRVAIAENVKNLTGKKFKPQFDIVLKSLEDAGYNNYWQVLNAKDYGIPQNRERVFIVSIRKDIDNGGFKFPKPFNLNLRLKDLLEDEVADKYYINTEKSKLLLQKLKDTNQINDEKVCCDSSINEPKVREISNCITSRYDAGIQNQKQIGLCVVEPNKPVRLGNVYGEQFGGSFGGNVWDKNGISPTLKTTAAASQQFIIEEQPTLIGGMQEHQSIKTDGISTTLTSSMGSGGGYVPMVVESKPEETDKLIHIGNLTGGKWDKINESCRRVYSEDGLSPTIHTCQGGNTEPKVLIDSTIKKVDIPQTVKYRKYKIDCESLCKCLREHKSNTNLTNKEIAEKLSVPITKVEHWFRQDNSFAIPDSELWLQLKEVLGIKTDEFDKAIMTFEEKEGVYEKSERHYFTDGIAPTLTSTSAGNEKIIISDKIINPLKDKTSYGWHFEQGVYDTKGITRALKASSGSGNIPKVIIEDGDANE